MEKEGNSGERIASAPEVLSEGIFGGAEALPEEKNELQEARRENNVVEFPRMEMPPELPPVEVEQDVVENTFLDVKRNAEQMSKKDMKRAEREIDKKLNEGDPKGAADAFDRQRSLYIGGAFGRVREHENKGEAGKAA